MSCSYADGLSPYENKGKLGLKEKFDSKETVAAKVETLAEWILSSNHVVAHTGAGISTAAGIPDFRGPNGVWTLEAQGKKPDKSLSFDAAVPTKTHMALVKLMQQGKIQYIVSQNIDGLHLRSGIPRRKLAELHGNMFVEQCSACKRQFVRNTATTSVGQKNLGTSCPASKINGRVCRGKMHDVILDWEHNLPEKDLELSDYHSSLSDLSICLGTTLQIIPSGNLPLKTKKHRKGKVVICNLQPTKHDKKADLIINYYVDDIMMLLLERLEMKCDEYSTERDPVLSKNLIEWTIPDDEIAEVKKAYNDLCLQTKRAAIAASPIAKKPRIEQDLQKGIEKPKIKLEKDDFRPEKTRVKLEKTEVTPEKNRVKLEKEEVNPEVTKDNLETEKSPPEENSRVVLKMEELNPEETRVRLEEAGVEPNTLIRAH